MFTRAASKVFPRFQKRMSTLHVQSSFRDGGNVEMEDVTSEDSGAEQPALPSSAEVAGAYEVFASSMKEV